MSAFLLQLQFISSQLLLCFTPKTPVGTHESNTREVQASVHPPGAVGEEPCAAPKSGFPPGCNRGTSTFFCCCCCGFFFSFLLRLCAGLHSAGAAAGGACLPPQRLVLSPSLPLSLPPSSSFCAHSENIVPG